MAETVFPFLAPKTQSIPVDGREDEFRVVVDGEDTGVVLGGAALRVAFEFDGHRAAVAIADDLVTAGIPVPGADFVSALAESLAQVGLVQLLEMPLERPYRRSIPGDVVSLHPLRHRCTGCGRSCEGQLFGPLDEAYLERAERVHAEMVDLYPHLARFAPYWKVEDKAATGDRYALTTDDDGTCIYLGEDRLCTVHKHLGSDQKPLVCRLFPLTIVQAEDGVRVGTPLRCYTHHTTWRTVDEATPEAMTGIPEREMPSFTARGFDPGFRGRVILNPEPDSSYAQMLRAEEHLIGLMLRPGTTIELVLAMLYELGEGQALRRPVQGLVHNSDFGAETVRRLQHFAQGVRPEISQLLDRAPKGGHVEEVRGLLDFLEGLSPRPFQGLSEIERSWAMRTLTEWLFVREWVHQPSMLVGLFLVVVGILVARWRSEEAGDGVEGEISDPFGYTLACWTRLIRIDVNFVHLVPDEQEFHGWLQSLQSGG